MLAEILFYKTPKRLRSVVLLQQLHGGVQVGEILHGGAKLMGNWEL
jgi:hypothetical protein